MEAAPGSLSPADVYLPEGFSAKHRVERYWAQEVYAFDHYAAICEDHNALC